LTDRENIVQPKLKRAWTKAHTYTLNKILTTNGRIKFKALRNQINSSSFVHKTNFSTLSLPLYRNDMKTVHYCPT